MCKSLISKKNQTFSVKVGLSKAVLLDISNKYTNIHGSDAMTILKEWDKGTIIYPYQKEWNRKTSETKTEKTEEVVTKADIWNWLLLTMSRRW